MTLLMLNPELLQWFTNGLHTEIITIRCGSYIVKAPLSRLFNIPVCFVLYIEFTTGQYCGHTENKAYSLERTI